MNVTDRNIKKNLLYHKYLLTYYFKYLIHDKYIYVTLLKTICYTFLGKPQNSMKDFR